MLHLDIHSWQIARSDANQLLVRPSALTALTRFGVSLVCLLICGGIYAGYHGFTTNTDRSVPLSDSDRAQREELERLAREMERNAVEQGLMTQDEIDTARQHREQNLAQARSSMTRTEEILSNVLLGIIGVFGFIAILAPLSAYWESVRFTTDAYGRLVLRQRGSLGLVRKKQYEPNTFTAVSVHAQEHQRHEGNGVYRTVGWMWHVRAQSMDGAIALNYALELNPNRPLENSRVPERTLRFAEALARLARCPLVQGYQILNLADRSGGIVRTRVTFTSAPKVIQEQKSKTVTYEEAPPEIRAIMDRVREKGGAPISLHQAQTLSPSGESQAITFRDAEGNVHNYASVDEMPPDIRAAYELIRDSL